MGSAVRSRANHYETLGLTPGASDDEIRSAFARMMGMFGAHPVVAATTVSAAFEVLRDPAKRRDYDRAIGLLSEPKSDHWRVAGVGWNSPGLMGAAWAPPAKHWTGARDAPAQGNATQTEQSLPAQPRLASFISSSLRDLARPIAAEAASDPRPQAEPQPGQAQKPLAGVEPALPTRKGPDREITLDAEYSPLDLRRPALIALGAVVAAGLIGAIAGASAGDQEQPQPAKRGVTVALPLAPPQPSGAVPRVVAARIGEGQTQRPRPAEAKPASVKVRIAERQRIAAAAAPLIERNQASDSELAANPPAGIDDVRSESGSATARAVTASLPLPNRVIARTIARIGYSCGTVVSTTNVEGAGPGVYKVACSSGETFQATPVRGRYRFRRAGQ